jgi:hypothetical protein
MVGLQVVCQVKGWKVQQIVFVGGTCGSIHVESFNRNMKSLGVLESKWDPIHKKLVRRLLEEQDKVIQSYFAQKGGTRSKGEDRSNCKGLPYTLRGSPTHTHQENRKQGVEGPQRRPSQKTAYHTQPISSI